MNRKRRDRKRRDRNRRGHDVEQLERRRLLTTYYVDNNAGDNGSNTNSGTALTAPFLTIQQAANIALPGDTVDIVAGTYREEVIPAHSGTAAAPIIYQAFNGGDVVVSGANLVSGWSQYSGNIYETSAMNWTMGGQDDQVYVDGQLMNYARWPNTSLNVSSPNWELTGANTTGVINPNGTITNTVYDPNLTQPSGYWNGATIHIESGETWIYEAATISNYTLTTINGTSYGVITYTSSYTGSNYYTAVQGDPYYITGDPFFSSGPSAGQFQNLDSAGEFYRDPNSGILYLWTPFSDSPASHVVEAKTREWAFDLSGLSYINLGGINIFAAGINSSATSSHLTLNGITAQYVSGFENYTGNWTPTLLNGINVIGGTGIVLDGGYDTLENSTIAYSAGEGVFLGGSNNTIYDNVIHDVDYAGLNAAAITTLEYSTTLSSNDNISFNTLYNGARTLIEASAITASHIDNNLIYNAMLQTADGGAIYTFAGNGGGTEIDDNIIYNSENNVPGYSCCGIFLDASSTGFTLDHNVIYNATEGIKFYQTSANNVLNNTIDNTDTPIELSSLTATGTVANNIMTSPIYLPFGDVGMTVSNNLQPPTDPEFLSQPTGNYQLQPSSPAINAGIVVAPYTNGYLGSAPDLGAYEYGATPWSAGATNAAAIPAFDPVPAPWTNQDIGSPAVTGSSTYSNGVFDVSGGGDDIWNSADQFQFVDTAVTGDQTIVARLTGQANTHPWAKAGVMFRTSTAANSPFAMVVQTPGNGINFMWRDASGNLGYVTAAGMANPVWLKLVRSGSTFTAYDSSDGVNWNNIDTITMPMAASGLMGLAVCSHNTTQICTVTFDNVSLQLQSPTGLVATSATTSAIGLSWNATPGASGYQIQRSTNGTTFSTVATLGLVTSYTDSASLLAGTEYYYRIIATGSLGSSSASSIVTATTVTLAPASVSAVASAVQTTLSWTAVTGAVSYNVYRGTTSGGESATPIAMGITASTYADTNVRTGVVYYYYITAVNGNLSPLSSGSAKSTEVSVSAGIITSVPATLLAVNYDLGGQGVAYNSSSSTNPGGVYRNDGVDIQSTTANGGGYYVGNTQPGEWLNYTLSVSATGYFSFTTLAASAYTGGTFHIDIDNTNVSGVLTVPDTGNAQVYSTVTTGPVQITAGKHVIQLGFDTATGGQVGNFFSVAVATAAAPTPAVPTGLTAAAGVGSISLSWTAGTYNTTFNVYRATTPGGEGTTPLATGIITTNYTDNTATAGTKYYYTVAGVYGTKTSAASSEASATSVVTAILDPSFELSSVNGSYVYDPTTANWKFTGNAGIEANGSAWNAAPAPDGTQAAFLQSLSQTSGGTLSQSVAFASSGRFNFSFDAAQRASFAVEPIVISVDGSALTTLTPTSTSFLNYTSPAISLSAGPHTLTFATSATSASDAASFIDLVSVNVLPNLPNAPTAVSATAGVGKITLAWNGPTGTSNGTPTSTVTYDIYRGTASGGESTTPLATGITTNTYTDTTAIADTTYYYTVTAVSSGLQSVVSAEVSASATAATATVVKISGTVIGTAGSWDNDGNTIANVFDGNFNTYFDAPTGSLTNWVGLDMGTARTVTQIQYAPRAGYEYRMYGGQFQVSNSATFASGVVTLFTINAIPTAGKFTTVQVNPGAAYRYIRFIGGTQWVNIAEVEVDGLQAPHQLTGTPIGTQTSYLNNGDTIAQVFDGNLNTYFDAPNSSLTNWVGLDLGAPSTITQIAFAPRPGYEFRMYGGQFQVSTTADFSSNVVTVYTITSIPVAGQLTTVNVNIPSQYRYIRFVGGTQWVNIAEMEVIGTQ